MDTSHISDLIRQLDSNVSGLGEALEPLLGGDLNETASKLPVLDRAKLYVFATYAIESVLFSNLRLQGIDAKTHPVFTELTRVRQYFEKIKNAETAGQKPTMTLDKAAAGRILKHDLATSNRQKSGSHAARPQGSKRRFEDGEISNSAGRVESAGAQDSSTDSTQSSKLEKI